MPTTQLTTCQSSTRLDSLLTGLEYSVFRALWVIEKLGVGNNKTLEENFLNNVAKTAYLISPTVAAVDSLVKILDIIRRKGYDKVTREDAVDLGKACLRIFGAFVLWTTGYEGIGLLFHIQNEWLRYLVEAVASGMSATVAETVIKIGIMCIEQCLTCLQTAASEKTIWEHFVDSTVDGVVFFGSAFVCAVLDKVTRESLGAADSLLLGPFAGLLHFLLNKLREPSATEEDTSHTRRLLADGSATEHDEPDARPDDHGSYSPPLLPQTDTPSPTATSSSFFKHVGATAPHLPPDEELECAELGMV